MDVVLAKLKSQRKHVHIQKHKAIAEMRQELLRLIHSFDTDLRDPSLVESKLVEEADLPMPPPSP